MSQTTIGPMTITTVRTTCQQCGESHVATDESDYPHGAQPEPPPFWLVKFQPPNEPNIEFRQWVCPTCAYRMGGSHLVKQLNANKTRSR